MPYKDKEKQKEKNREYNKKRYLENKEYYILKSKEQKRKNKLEFQEYKKTLSCEICGENHPATLDFHHKDKSEKKMIVSDAVGRGYSKKNIKSEIEKCIVLCANCHRKIHYDEMTVFFEKN